ncbi:hypothetical protein ACFQ48_20720 [Hymenobacter caeli]|uniref:Uncharacterized protein n=1 Tax=Hymenobacter caeli TaxID=2735894 RepID=A0ABX2FW20_9BACT|nr:hypothetical protein [Hymenobacter caeli]NRT21391.1 hypothetical protein [Hymenobacter caeli]
MIRPLLFPLPALLLTSLAATPARAQINPTKTALCNDAFVKAARLDLKPFLAKYKATPFSKRQQLHPSDPKQTDYVLTYALGTDKFVFYQTPAKTLAVSFVATSGKLRLAKGVHVGMSKKAFETAFKHEIANTATVADAEHLQRYTFTFTRQQLSSIVYQGRTE